MSTMSTMSTVKIPLLLFPLLSGVLTAFASPTPNNVLLARQEPGLHAKMQAKGKYFGTFSDTKYLTDTAYTDVAGDANEFGAVTPGNSMKWDSTEPSKGDFSFTTPDGIVEFAAEHGQFVRGHTLVWHSQLPQWVKDIDSEDEIREVMNNHITTVMAHYEGKNVEHWDVVNEPFDDSGEYRDSVFYNLLGKDFIATAFRTAREASADAKLYLNEYNNDFAGKGDSFYTLAQELKAADVPIDGVGIQGHYIVGGVPSGLQNRMQGLADLGLDVAITELDIRIESPTDDAKLEQQAKDFEFVTNACLAVERCVGITVSAMTDKYSWVPDTFPGYDDANLFDKNLEKKPAYERVSEALN
ncbi:hypothetical protein AJ79_09255 [Helicocarpus griseus UAMH5409]|uniref:Beta-xylanase n=1 Tax=Helicocarpus griseus UAMH5409 TaxID=1447875 RepID=A0A2B7WCZ1_9EURO|nr:hypothetical protein AJ79_09255 [Helicocarpus griseus UAMH5409]